MNPYGLFHEPTKSRKVVSKTEVTKEPPDRGLTDLCESRDEESICKSYGRAAPRALESVADAAEFPPTFVAGRVSWRRHQVKRTIADRARSQRGITPFVRQWLQAPHDRIPVQSDSALAFAPLDRQMQ